MKKVLRCEVVLQGGWRKRLFYLGTPMLATDH